MKVLRRVLIVTFFAAVIIAAYAKLTSKSAKDVEVKVDDSPVGQILAQNMDLNYPANPRDVVILYSKIIKAYYGENYTDDQLVGLAQHARALFDDELLACNEYEVYMTQLKADIAAYKALNKVISVYTIQRSADVEMFIDDGIQYARVKAIYYTAEVGATERTEVYEQYTLRKTDDRWKILFWEVIPKTIVKGD